MARTDEKEGEAVEKVEAPAEAGGESVLWGG